MNLRKNFRATPTKWRRYLSNEEVLKVHTVCVDVMKLLDYKFHYKRSPA